MDPDLPGFQQLQQVVQFQPDRHCVPASQSPKVSLPRETSPQSGKNNLKDLAPP
jgi:hypothetical protein